MGLFSLLECLEFLDTHICLLESTCPRSFSGRSPKCLVYRSCSSGMHACLNCRSPNNFIEFVMHNSFAQLLIIHYAFFTSTLCEFHGT